MRIQHNIMAMNAYRNYNQNTKALSGNLEKLSSGYKINRAGDDAAGLAISEKMRAQIKGLDAAQKNVKDGISLVKTAEGAMQEIQDMLGRMKYLATQSANGTYDNDVDRNNLQKEVDSLISEINRIADSANFNGINLLDGKMGFASGGGTTGTTAASPLEAQLDAANAAKLGDVTVAFAADATDEQKAALNKALAGDIKITTTDGATANTWDAGDKIKLDKLPAGYTATFKDATGTDAALTAGADITVGTGAGNLAAADDLEITLSDADGNAVATITVGKPTAGASGTTTVTFAEAQPAAATAAAGDADAAKKYEVEITGGDANALADGDKISINGKDYALKATGAGASDIDLSGGKNATFAEQMKAAVDLYNADTNEDYTAEYADGKLTFTAKDGKTPANAPTFGITDAAGKITSGTVEEVEAEAGNNGGGAGTGSIKLHIGDSSANYDTLDVSIQDMHAAALGIGTLDISSQDAARASIDIVKNAINTVSSVRGDLGAIQNRLDHTANNLSVMAENIQDAESTIRDTDVADEMMKYVKNNILVQSAQAMLAQANQVPQGVLQLLG